MSKSSTVSLLNGPRRIELAKVMMLQLETLITHSMERTSRTMMTSASSSSRREESSTQDQPQVSPVEAFQARSISQSAASSLKMELSKVRTISKRSSQTTQLTSRSQLVTRAAEESWQLLAGLPHSRPVPQVSSPCTMAPGPSTVRSLRNPNELKNLTQITLITR